MGNICRSPIAEGFCRAAVKEAEREHEFGLDSAGTLPWGAGKPPDRRAIEAAARRGVDIRRLRGRVVSADDFHQFDLIVAMDRSNLRNLIKIRPPHARAELRLLMEFADEEASERDGVEIPDPFFGSRAGFERTVDMIEPAIAGLLRAHPPRRRSFYRKAS